MSEPTLQCFYLALPKRLVAKGVKIAIRLVLHVCFSNIQPKRLDAWVALPKEHSSRDRACLA